ncbi:MAG: hypothetical protein FWC57_04715 [Endomicrobia bacterium]|nr:hypothetical protein [Endomicrobiia bacterium]
MKIRKETSIIVLLFAALLIFLAARSVAAISKERSNAPREQHIAEALLSVNAPPLLRNEKTELHIKESRKNDIKDILFLSGFYRKAEYTVNYVRYSNEAMLESAAASVINLFKNDDFKYSAIKNEIDARKGMRLEGTFVKDGKNFGIKVQFIKEGGLFWQIMTIYRNEKNGEELASKFINSIKLDAKAVN